MEYGQHIFKKAKQNFWTIVILCACGVMSGLSVYLPLGGLILPGLFFGLAIHGIMALEYNDFNRGGWLILISPITYFLAVIWYIGGSGSMMNEMRMLIKQIDFSPLVLSAAGNAMFGTLLFTISLKLICMPWKRLFLILCIGLIASLGFWGFQVDGNKSAAAVITDFSGVLPFVIWQLSVGLVVVEGLRNIKRANAKSDVTA